MFHAGVWPIHTVLSFKATPTSVVAEENFEVYFVCQF